MNQERTPRTRTITRETLAYALPFDDLEYWADEMRHAPTRQEVRLRLADAILAALPVEAEPTPPGYMVGDHGVAVGGNVAVGAGAATGELDPGVHALANALHDKEFGCIGFCDPASLDRRSDLHHEDALDIIARLTSKQGQPDPEPPEEPEGVCGRCGGPNLMCWHAPSPLWNAVMRPYPEPFSGIICPRCFGELAREKGVADFFCLTTHDAKVPLASVFGDGRVWDAEKCKWVEAA